MPKTENNEMNITARGNASEIKIALIPNYIMPVFIYHINQDDIGGVKDRGISLTSYQVQTSIEDMSL